VLVLGARASGQVSTTDPYTSATVAAFARAPLAFPVTAITAAANSVNGPSSRTISSLSPECERTTATSSG
jgi:hypothetical protein